MTTDNMWARRLKVDKYFLGKNLKRDFPASIVVFLVALPLCLGVAMASGAPLFAGLLAGIVGGIVVSSFSGSQLSVTGPAAGLTVIVLNAITNLGAFDAFLLAVVIAGVMQMLIGLLKAGTVANYFPSSVIEGMLAAIGIILILKQLPHAVGYDADFQGSEQFSQPNHENTFSAMLASLQKFNIGAIIISVLSLAVMIYWPKVKKLAIIPAPLIVVVLGIVLAALFGGSSFMLHSHQMVQIPIVKSFTEFQGLFVHPDFSKIMDKQVWTVAATIAIVASLESLLSLEAVDKIDPIKRVSPANRELIAQGIGNTVSGLLGGLPVTSVIVRSSANVNAGARTKVSAIFHGIWLLVAVLFIPFVINMIPLACLAAILLFTGYKLAKVALFKKMWANGKDQFIPFIVTVVAVVFTDLLTGVGIGMLVGVIYLLRVNLRNAYFYKMEKEGDNKVMRMRLAEEVSFLNKGAIQYALTHLPTNSEIIIDGSNSRFIDRDVLEVIENFKINAYTKNIKVHLVNIQERYSVPKLDEMNHSAENQ